MSKIYKFLLGPLFAFVGDEKKLSVDEIAERMTPVEEGSLRLPRSFAHNLRIIVEAEAQDQNFKRMSGDREIISRGLH